MNLMNSLTNLIIPIVALAIAGFLLRVAWGMLVTVVVVPMHHVCLHSRNGKSAGLLESGRHRFFGKGHGFQCFDKRLQQLTLQTQELTTLEGITVKTTAVGLYRVVDPIMATSATADFNATLYTLVQLALRDAFAGIEAEALLSNVRNLGPKLLDMVQPKATGLGLYLTELVVRDVIFPADIKAALSECWRSKKSALAELETARGKTAAARTMANAAKLYEANPSLLQIRYIEAIEQAAKSVGNTFVIGLPNGAAASAGPTHP
jgi:regulator of protease activity HflC (stomatin/prohibitin superfamily)